MLTSIFKQQFSKYRNVTDIVNKYPKPEKPKKEEAIIKFKPYTQTVYKTSNNILPYKDYDHPITREHEVAEVALQTYDTRMEDIISPPNAKVISVGIFGPTNSGKSSLFNTLIGRTISAVSNKRFTTNKSIFGVKTDLSTNTQISLYDLPGYPIGSPEFRFYQYEAYKTIEEIKPNKLLMVFDANKTIQKDELITLNKIREKYADSLDFIMILNKLDLCFNRRKLYDLVSACESMMNFENKFYVSTATDYGISSVLDHIINQASPGKWSSPQGYTTDLSEVAICHQQIKSILYERFFDEFPYEIRIRIVEFYICQSHIRIGVKLNAERELHKKILVGENGKNLVVLKNHIAKQLMTFYNKFVEVVLTINYGIKDSNEPFITESAVDNRVKSEIAQIKAGKGVKSLDK